MPSQELQEVDNNFIGLNTRLDPSNLQPGFLQEAYNVRLQRGTAQPRKGCQRLTNSSLNSQTMVGSGTYVDENGQDSVVMVFSDRMYLYNTETNTLSQAYIFPSYTYQIIDTPPVSPVNAFRGIEFGGIVDVVQALNKLYIFRGSETKRYGTGITQPTSGCTLTYSDIPIGSTGTVTLSINSAYSDTGSGILIGKEFTLFNVYDTGNASKAAFNNTWVIKTAQKVSGTWRYTFDVPNTSSLAITGGTAYACICLAKPALVWDGVSTALSVVPQTSIFGNLQKTFPSSGVPQDVAGEGSLPPSDFAFYFQNRIVCKFKDTQLAVSDILSETVDFMMNNFIINQGGNDEIVGVLPWIENQFLVFMSKSIYIAFVEPTTYGTGAPPGINSSITVVTTQIGCLARRSIVAAGQFVFFLSGKGVHVLSPQLDLKLLGNTLPLSEPIDDVFDDVNYSYIKLAVSAYYDNRFFIALPTGASTRPNFILVYNTLNQQWESFDYYPVGNYVDNYAVCQYGNKRRLFMLSNYNGTNAATGTIGQKFVQLRTGQGGAVLAPVGYAVGMQLVSDTGFAANTVITQIATDGFYISNPVLVSSFTLTALTGGVFLTEELEAGDQTSGNLGSPVLPFYLPQTLQLEAPQIVSIPASIRSREYTFGSTNEKRFSRAEYQFNDAATNRVQVNSRTHDPDAFETVMEYQFVGSSTADSTLRPRIGTRGSVLDLEVKFLNGRPALKSVAVYAITANRNMVSQE